MKKFTTLLLAILLVLPAMAAEKVQNESRFYFALPSGWSNACFMVGHGSYSQGYDMLKVENTNLYFHEQNGDWSADDNNLQWSVFDAQGWGGETNNLDHRKGYSAHAIAIYYMNGDFEYQKYYLLADGSYENIASYTSLNHTQTVTIEGGEGTITMSSYNLTAANTAAATSGTTSVEAAYTANVECTATAADGYRFVGWYNGETPLSDKPTYTYVAENADKTIVAKFEEVTAETPVLSNFTASATEVMVGETITFTCAVENGEVANIVYKINNEAIVGNTWTPEACGVYTATATYEGATPVELASTITVKEEVVFNVTVPEGTPACYIVGNFNGQNWDSFNLMEKEDDTHYTWSFITTTMDFVYKYTWGADWAYEEDINGNRTWSENDVVSAWKISPAIDDITYGVYCLDLGEIDWKAAGAWFSAYFYNISDDKISTWVRGVVDENRVYFGLEDKENTYTHVVFARFNPEAAEESWDDTDVDGDGDAQDLWNKTNDIAYKKPVNGTAVYQLTDWNTVILTDEIVVPTGLNRVELADGIGYAYGVVSAEGAIEVYNVNGAVVARGNDNVDLRGLGRGVYIIRNGNQVRKVVR